MSDTKLLDIFCEVLNVDADVYNEELGVGDIPQWDSLGHVNLIMAVEASYGVAFDAIDAIEIETIGDLIDMLDRYLES